jgi:hypothetical protein
MNPVERAFTFMFRPLFVDAPGVTGQVASVENLVLLGFMGLALASAWRVRGALRGFRVRFNVLHALPAWIMLAEVTANLGLAVRQKTMVLPSLLALSLLVLAQAYPGRRAARPAAVPARPATVPPLAPTPP